MYLIVPEYHKDGAIHFHGLVAGNLNFVDSGHQDKKGHVIYNMPQWSLGYSTAIELYGNRQCVASYITKYITKDFKKIFGKFYYSGGGVKRDVETVYCNLDYDKIAAQEYRRFMGYKYLGFDANTDENCFDI